jgi:hypothetical protein
LSCQVSVRVLLCAHSVLCCVLKRPKSSLVSRPVFRYFMPLGPRKFCPPIFVRIQLCVSKNNTKNWQKTKQCFQYRSPLNCSLVDSLSFSRYHTSISIFLICRPWKFAALGPGPFGPCVNMALLVRLSIHLRLQMSQPAVPAYPVSADLWDAVPLFVVSQPHPVVTLTWCLQQSTFPVNSGPILLLFFIQIYLYTA